MPEWVTALLAILGNVTGIWKRKGDQNNTPEMQKRAGAQQTQAEHDQVAATTDQAMHGDTPEARAEALRRAREQDSE